MSDDDKFFEKLDVIRGRYDSHYYDSDAQVIAALKRIRGENREQ